MTVIYLCINTYLTFSSNNTWILCPELHLQKQWAGTLLFTRGGTQDPVFVRWSRRKCRTLEHNNTPWVTPFSLQQHVNTVPWIPPPCLWNNCVLRSTLSLYTKISLQNRSGKYYCIEACGKTQGTILVWRKWMELPGTVYSCVVAKKGGGTPCRYSIQCYCRQRGWNSGYTVFTCCRRDKWWNSCRDKL